MVMVICHGDMSLTYVMKPLLLCHWYMSWVYIMVCDVIPQGVVHDIYKWHISMTKNIQVYVMVISHMDMTVWYILMIDFYYICQWYMLMIYHHYILPWYTSITYTHDISPWYITMTYHQSSEKMVTPGFEHVTCGTKHHCTNHVTSRFLDALCNDEMGTLMTYVHDIYSWHTSMTYLHDTYSWHTSMTCVHDTYSWHTIMTYDHDT